MRLITKSISTWLLLGLLTAWNSLSNCSSVPDEDHFSDPKWLVSLIQNNTKDGLIQLPPDMAARVPHQFSQYINNPKHRIPDFILKNTALLTNVVTDVLKQNPPKTVPTTTTTTPLPTTTTVPTTSPVTTTLPNTTVLSAVVNGAPITSYVKEDVVPKISSKIQLGPVPSIGQHLETLFDAKPADSNSVDNSNPEYGISFFNSIRKEIEVRTKKKAANDSSHHTMPPFPYFMPPFSQPIFVVVNGSKVPAFPVPMSPYQPPFPIPPYPGLNGSKMMPSYPFPMGQPFFSPQYGFPNSGPKPTDGKHQSWPIAPYPFPMLGPNQANFQKPPCYKMSSNGLVPC